MREIKLNTKCHISREIDVRPRLAIAMHAERIYAIYSSTTVSRTQMLSRNTILG